MIYIDRDLSWLSFNERVLQEAADSDNPIIERLKFLAIFSANLEEFYKVRVAHQRYLISAGINNPNKFGSKPSEILKTIYKTVDKQQRVFGKLFYKVILPVLKEKGFQVIQDFDNERHIQAALSIYSKIENQITIQNITKRKNVFLKNQGNYLFLITKKRIAFKYFLIELNEEIGRFHMLEDKGVNCIFLLDDIIRVAMKHKLFADRFYGAYAIKLSRDAELYLDDEPLTKDLKQKIIDSLQKRESGIPTRLLFDELLPYKFLNDLMEKTKSDKESLVPGGKYHKFYDFFGFPELADHSLYFDDTPILESKALQKSNSIINKVLKEDVLLSFPYQSYQSVVDVLKEASEHPDVKLIQITLYRVAKDSQICGYLEKAIANNKKVIVYTELKARFDESSNIYWNKRLKEAGALIFDTVGTLKTHAKIFQIELEKDGDRKYIAHFGTGNFNEKTAKIYTDFSLMTADEALNKEVGSIFKFLTGKAKDFKTKLILGSPFNLRNQVEQLIQDEIEFAKKGKVAKIILKLNSLEDTEMIDLLYKASQKGVKIELIIRGICCIKPGVKGLSENITVVSLVGRYLEHARCYYFNHGGKNLMYCSSADFMKRNLDRRVEVGFPILNVEHKKFMMEYLEMQLNDNTNKRVLDKKLTNNYIKEQDFEKQVNAQLDIKQLIEKYEL